MFPARTSHNGTGSQVFRLASAPPWQASVQNQVPVAAPWSSRSTITPRPQASFTSQSTSPRAGIQPYASPAQQYRTILPTQAVPQRSSVSASGARKAPPITGLFDATATPKTVGEQEASARLSESASTASSVKPSRAFLPLSSPKPFSAPASSPTVSQDTFDGTEGIPTLACPMLSPVGQSKEGASNRKQVRFAREHNEQTQVAIVSAMVSDCDVVAARPGVVPEAPVTSGNDGAPSPTNMELPGSDNGANLTVEGGETGNISRSVGEQVSVDASADADVAGITADPAVDMDHVSKVSVGTADPQQVLDAERKAKDKTVEDFKQMLEEIVCKHASDFKALETRLADVEQRNAQLLEMKRETAEAHARDIAVLEVMVQSAMEENDRLACDVKTWKAAAGRRRSGNETGSSSNVSTGTSSGDESGCTERSTTSSPKLGAITPRSEESGTESSVPFARVLMKNGAVPIA